MKTFDKIAAQGEITIRRVGDLPKNRALPIGYTAIQPERGHYIIGHSETGHNHVLSAVEGATIGVWDKPPAGMRILHMILENPMSLDHQRPHDTHESIALEPGVYEVRIAREFDHYAELARQSAD